MAVPQKSRKEPIYQERDNDCKHYTKDPTAKELKIQPTNAVTQALVKSAEPLIFRALQTPDHQRSLCDHHAPQASGELSAKQAGCHLPKTSYSFPRPQAAHAKRHQQISPRRLLLHQHPIARTDGATAICMRQLRTCSLCKLSVLCLSLMIN